MAEHGYRQYCGAARALDAIGDRWTLLIVRELAFGPRRFTDLIEGLPGISRNLLAQRLRDLEREGVATQSELPPPAARRVYQLTADGRDLAEAMRPLVAWGARRLGERKDTEQFRPHWGALAMAAFADTKAVTANETYQYLIGRSAFYFRAADGSIELHDGRAETAAVMVTTDETTWADIASGKTTVAASITSGTLTITGKPESIARLKRILSRKKVLAGMASRVSARGAADDQ